MSYAFKIALFGFAAVTVGPVLTLMLVQVLESARFRIKAPGRASGA